MASAAHPGPGSRPCPPRPPAAVQKTQAGCGDIPHRQSRRPRSGNFPRPRPPRCPSRTNDPPFQQPNRRPYGRSRRPGQRFGPPNAVLASAAHPGPGATPARRGRQRACKKRRRDAATYLAVSHVARVRASLTRTCGPWPIGTWNVSSKWPAMPTQAPRPCGGW